MLNSPALDLVPVDATARDGRYRLVFARGPKGDAEFACVRWSDGEGWVFSSGRPLDFQPQLYNRDSAGVAHHG